jgi:hypothetical protein
MGKFLTNQAKVPKNNLVKCIFFNRNEEYDRKHGHFLHMKQRIGYICYPIIKSHYADYLHHFTRPVYSAVSNKQGGSYYRFRFELPMQWHQ